MYVLIPRCTDIPGDIYIYMGSCSHSQKKRIVFWGGLVASRYLYCIVYEHTRLHAYVAGCMHVLLLYIYIYTYTHMRLSSGSIYTTFFSLTLHWQKLIIRYITKTKKQPLIWWYNYQACNNPPGKKKHYGCTEYVVMVWHSILIRCSQFWGYVFVINMHLYDLLCEVEYVMKTQRNKISLRLTQTQTPSI